MDTITVNGQNLKELFGIFVTSWEDDPPEPETSFVSVPGRDGDVDLTDALAGWTVYGNRTIKVGLAADAGRTKQDALFAFTSVKRLVHGRRCRIEFSGDPGYAYTGRAALGDVAYLRGAWTCTLTATCLPYKSRGTMTYHLDAAYGKTVVIRSGAQPVCPVFEVGSRTLVNIDGTTYEFPEGTSRNLDLWLRGPATVITVNGTPDFGNAQWNNHMHRIWKDFAGSRLSKLAAVGSKPLTSRAWSDSTLSGPWSRLAGTWQSIAFVEWSRAFSWIPWKALSARRWEQVSGTWTDNGYELGAAAPRADTYIQFEWGDL